MRQLRCHTSQRRIQQLQLVALTSAHNRLLQSQMRETLKPSTATCSWQQCFPISHPAGRRHDAIELGHSISLPSLSKMPPPLCAWRQCIHALHCDSPLLLLRHCGSRNLLLMRRLLHAGYNHTDGHTSLRKHRVCLQITIEVQCRQQSTRKLEFWNGSHRQLHLS